MRATYRSPKFTVDRVPSSIDLEKSPTAFLSYQDYPGDRSIIQVKYEGGLTKAIETYGGSVEMDHQQNDDASGQETVTNGTTGAAAQVFYDSKKRVTKRVDFWGGETNYTYGDSGSIRGAMTEETDALGHVTRYGYPELPEAEYGSFAEMFEAYVNRQLGSDLDMRGYLTGAQGQPNSITQHATVDGQMSPLVTNITYDLDAESKSAFQPKWFSAPGSLPGEMSYDPTYGKLTSVKIGNDLNNPVTKTENEYFTTENTNVTERWKVGRLRSTTSYSGPGDETGTKTSYDYEQVASGGAFREKHTTTNQSTGMTNVAWYDASGNLVSSTSARGRVITSSQDGEGRATHSEDEDGNAVYAYYDVTGQRTMEHWHKVARTGEPEVDIYTYYEYDDAGRITRTWREAPGSAGILPASGGGGSSTSTSRSGGVVISDTRTIYESDATGRTETTIGSDGMGSRLYYDGGGRLLRSESLDRAGTVLNWSSYEYDKLGRKTSETNARGATTTYIYDELGRVTKTTLSASSVVAYEITTENGYDEAGRQKWVKTIGDGDVPVYTVFSYDALGRIEKTHFECSSTTDTSEKPYTEIEYDGKGRQSVIWDETRRGTMFEYHAVTGRQTTVTLGFDTPEAVAYVFEHDTFGNVTRIIDPKGHDRMKRYDPVTGRLTHEFTALCDDDSNSPVNNQRMGTEFEYYSNGQIWKKHEGVSSDGITLQRLRTTEFKYDWYRNRITEKIVGKTSAKPAGESRTVYTYTTLECASLLAHSSSTNAGPDMLSSVEIYSPPSSPTPAWYRHITFDCATLRIASVATPEGTIAYTHTPYGELASIKSSAGQDTSYTYDGLGKLSTVQSNLFDDSGMGQHVVAYNYNSANGRRARIEYPNGTTTNYAYDRRGNISEIRHEDGTEVLLGITYFRFENGLIWDTFEWSTTDGYFEQWREYNYDGLKRLTSYWAGDPESYLEGYTYDTVSNRSGVSGTSQVPYTYNALDQLISDGSKTYRYDSFGNLAEEREGSIIKRSYTWDSENRLAGVTLVNYDDNNHNKTITFGYDDFGTRVNRRVADSAIPNPNSAITTQYLTDYQNPTGYSQTLAELDPSKAAPERQYSWSDELVTQHSEGSAQYLYGDNLSSKRLIADVNGSVPTGEQLNYRPFGESADIPSNLTSYAFTGQYRDEHIGLQYHRARWLNCATASWMSADPMWDWPNNFGNPYLYAGGQPITQSDPEGRFVQLLAVAAIMAFAYAMLAVAIAATFVGVGIVAVTALAVGARFYRWLANCIWPVQDIRLATEELYTGYGLSVTVQAFIAADGVSNGLDDLLNRARQAKANRKAIGTLRIIAHSGVSGVAELARSGSYQEVYGVNDLQNPETRTKFEELGTFFAPGGEFILHGCGVGSPGKDPRLGDGGPELLRTLGRIMRVRVRAPTQSIAIIDLGTNDKLSQEVTVGQMWAVYDPTVDQVYYKWYGFADSNDGLGRFILD